MPAIQPARLKQQAALLVENFSEPAPFIRSLHHLLDFYADRAHRPGQAGAPPPLLAAYNVPAPVLRQLLKELAPLAGQDPQAALLLCDALWERPSLEFRLLAASLLGLVPPDPLEPVLSRLQAWLHSGTEERLVAVLLDHGTARLRRENPACVISLIEDWLAGPQVFDRQLGLRTLLLVGAQPGFENLPVFFRLIQPLVRIAPAALRPDLLDVLAMLARRSPQETAYFLRQALDSPDSPDTAWLIRQSLREFPPQTEESLRSAVRGFESRKDVP